MRWIEVVGKMGKLGSGALAMALGLAAVGALAADESDTPARRLTLERLYSLPRLIGTAPSAFAWSPDGRHLAFLWNDEGTNFRDVWTIEAGDPEGSLRRLTRMARGSEPAEVPDDPVAAAEAAERVERDAGVRSVIWHPDGERLLVGFEGDLLLISEGQEPRAVAADPAPEFAASYSPDGQRLAFLRGGDVWTLPSEPDALPARQLTRVAGDARGVSSYRWSPGGTRIALMERDQSGVTLRGIPDYLTEETSLREVRRAYPGEEPVRQRLGVVALDSGVVEWLGLDTPEPDMLLSYLWSPDGRWLAVDTSDLYAKDRRLLLVDPDGETPPRPLAQDLDPLNETFYFWRIAWRLDSGAVYFLSDRDEDYHVYSAPLDGNVDRLTSGAWAVSQMHPVEGGLIVVGNRDRAEERRIFRVSDHGGDAVQLSRSAGTHSPTVSPDGIYAAVHFSSESTPPELLLTKLSGEGTEAPVTASPVEEFGDFRWVEASYVTFESHVDGTTLHGRLTLPPDFDPQTTYPAILGSVYTDSVRNQWGGRTSHPTWGLDQYLAQEGYVLLNVDMRGSWGRGREHRRGIRLDYGGMDIEDLESGVRFLGSLGYVDLDRVGIWGSSYGGLMTAMSLFRKPGLYAAGVAGAPATNVWHALTGQMAVMMRPEDQPEEYADSSPFRHADGLEDPLMIIHGMRDRVVLFKDSVILTQRLLMLDKDVDLVALPNAGHGWDNEGLAQTRFAFRKLVDHFDRHLKAD